MKVEHLTVGYRDCPLIRLFDFTAAEAETLRQGVRSLADGERTRLDLIADCNASPVEGFALGFAVGHHDVGLTIEGYRNTWTLRPESWDEIEGLIEPFCTNLTGFQWLSEVGKTSLLLSPSGSW